MDISPSARFCITEAEIVTALYKGLKSLKAAEEATPVKTESKKVEKSDKPGKLVYTEADIPICVAKIAEIKKKFPDNCMAQAFDEAYFKTLSVPDQLRLLVCCGSGIANEDSGMGCYAMSPSDYDDFRPFFSKALELYHKVDLT